jgi:AAA15 family ATPase/GTPase
MIGSINNRKEENHMLLQFLVENFRSFQKETILNLAPAKSRIHPDHLHISEKEGPKARALPLAVFYGANAAGKSNLIRAINFARNLIVEGTRGENSIETVPFRLGKDSNGSPSRFEFVIKHDGVIYTYGFAATNREVKEEWLFATYERREIRLFERITKEGKAHLEFGKKLAPHQGELNRLQFVASGTRPNQLFLTEANDRNVTDLKPLLHWFRDHLLIIWPEAIYSPLVIRAHGDKPFTNFLSTYLNIADTGIHGIELESHKMDDDKFLSTLPEEEKKNILEQLDKNPDHSVLLSRGKSFYAIQKDANNSLRSLTFKTQHKKTDGSIVSFNTEDESDGTHRMMHMAPALLDLQTSDKVYVIDELDRSMHPILCRLFVQAFLLGIKDGTSKGQILLTTHETSLLDLDILRRDEIWFVEKDNECSSRLTSLAEFKVRADLTIDKGYLNGRFGAIPFLGDIRNLYRKPE